MLTLEKPAVHDIVNAVMPRASDKTEESYWFLSFNHASEIKAVVEIPQESVKSIPLLFTFVRPRLHLSMAGCAVVHYTFCTACPEEIDRKIVENMRFFTHLYDKEFVDYVVATADESVSFRERGLI